MMVYFFAFLVPLLIFIPLGNKWELKMKIVVLWSIVMGLVSAYFSFALGKYLSVGEPILQVSAGVFVAVAITGAFTLLFFFRDPERVPPEGEGQIISPADGTVLYVKEIKSGEFPFAVKKGKKIPLVEFIHENLIPDSGIHIGIGMNLLNVHVNRVPIPGRVRMLKRIQGGFFSLKKKESLLENERVLTIIQNGDLEVGVVQIASRLVRRICSYVEEGEEVVAGQKLGMIRFGSQVDVLIPHRPGLVSTVGPGDEVKAGESVIAVY